MDESGDFTDGAGLSEAQADVIMGFVLAGEEVTTRLTELMALLRQLRLVLRPVP
jgi:histidyl-tRNA synthetase